MAGRADLREEAVRLAELSLAPLPVAALVRELGELDVDQRLERPRAPLARACERRLDVCTRRGAGRAEQGPRQRQARVPLVRSVPPRAGDLEPFPGERA